MATATIDPAQAFENKLLARMEPVHKLTANDNSAVQQFYSGSTVFMTGGSGFLGKQLIEKLLRATNTSKIFVLLRCKKGKSIPERLTEMLEDPVYDTLREQKPNFSEKIIPVSGDVGELRLGLCEKDWNIITEQVDIIFHMAATTRFDEPIRVATLINVRGTREALILGKACKKLRSYVHVSTAFSHACMDKANTKVFEEFYKTPVEPHTMIKLVETIEEERLNNITPSLIKNWPNTYTFAKALAEELVNTMGDNLPICVVRPAIVIHAAREPVPGWIDMSCIYGASGVLLAGGLGVAHILHADDKLTVDFIPVDYVNNAIIAAGWNTASDKSIAEENKIKIYTLSPFSRNPQTFAKVYGFITNKGRQYPSPAVVAYPFTYSIKNPLVFWFLSWFFHLLPAYIVDGICVLTGQKRRFAKLAYKLYNLSIALCHFTTKNWFFDDKNTKELFDKLSPADQKIFDFDVENIDWEEFMVTWCLGLRKYVVKDGLKDTLYARRKMMVLLMLLLIIFPLYVYSLFKIVSLIFSYMFVVLKFVSI